MFGLGVTEVFVILVVAFLLFGPQQLPEVGRQVGKAVKSLRDATDHVRQSVEPELNLMQAEMTAMEQQLNAASQDTAPSTKKQPGTNQSVPEGVEKA